MEFVSRNKGNQRHILCSLTYANYKHPSIALAGMGYTKVLRLSISSLVAILQQWHRNCNELGTVVLYVCMQCRLDMHHAECQGVQTAMHTERALVVAVFALSMPSYLGCMNIPSTV